MRYVGPLNKPPGASYVEGNPAQSVPSSIVPAAAIEHPMREITEVIRSAGLEESGQDLTQLRQAIQAMITEALGGSAPQGNVTTAMLAGHPTFPEILSADGRINITSPSAGTILVPSGVSYRFRGFFTHSTSDIPEAQRLFTTLPNRIYHLVVEQGSPLVWALRDLSDPAYNPDQLAETHASFDSTFSRMITARIVTNDQNVATITTLTNRDSFRFSGEIELDGGNRNGAFEDNAFPSAIGNHQIINLNFARRPLVAINAINDISFVSEGVAIDSNEINIGLRVQSRYGLRVWWQRATPREDGIRLGYAVWI